MPRNNPYSDVPIAPSDLDIKELSNGREAELDIGFGRGHFILDRAEARPDTTIIGLEMRRKWVNLVGQRALQRGLTTVEVFFGDAKALLPGWGPDGSLTSVFINFPDPWWKKRHQKRLVVTTTLIREVARLLRPGGVLLVQTDVQERARKYGEVLVSEPTLSLVQGDADSRSEQNPLGVMSHRELKCAQAGLPVFRFLLRKDR